MYSQNLQNKDKLLVTLPNQNKLLTVSYKIKDKGQMSTFLSPIKLFFFLLLLSGRIDPIIIVKLAKSAYWVNVNGSRPNNIIKIAKKFESRRFSAKSHIAQPFRKRGKFSLEFWRWISSFLLGQDFGDGIPPFYWVSGFK